MNDLLSLGIASQFERRIGKRKVVYIPVGAITNISPDSVTFEDNTFLISGEVYEFTFDDNGVRFMAFYSFGQWTIFESSYPYIFDQTFDNTFN